MSVHDGPEGSSLESLDYDPSTPTSEVDPELDGSASSRKKRKAWGQPIPEFEKIIGPRKRAKTQAERTQRAHERTLRNRRAAAQSRDKKQAQFAAMEKENEALKEQLAQYHARFGILTNETSSTKCEDSSKRSESHLDSYPSPLSETTLDQTTTMMEETAPLDIHGPPQDPILRQDLSKDPSFDLSSTLTPSLQLGAQPLSNETLYPSTASSAMDEDFIDATQYSAAVLSDPQCQASMESSIMAPQMRSSHLVQLNWHLTNLTMLMTIFENFSTSMLSPMYRIFRILAGDFSMPSIKQEDLDRHFQLIHCLIMSPMKGTARPVFRMKLLSRLLACNPVTARLITVAADRALQQQVSEGLTLEDRESRQKWASLLTVRWTIKWLDKEHARYRGSRRTGTSSSSSEPPMKRDQSMGAGEKCYQGVDYRAIEQNLRRWDKVDLSEGLVAL